MIRTQVSLDKQEHTLAKKEAKALLLKALKPSLGNTSFDCTAVEWEDYRDKVTFTLEPVEPTPLLSALEHVSAGPAPAFIPTVFADNTPVAEGSTL